MIEDCVDDSALEEELREEGLETTRKEIGWIEIDGNGKSRQARKPM